MLIFTNVIKPTHRCNLACRYCYNDDERAPFMSEPTLERVVEQTFVYVRKHHPKRWINFIWHGGEPMLAGVEFYERAVELQKRLADGLAYKNTIQTNGTAINDRWVRFFRQASFSISVSIDGPRALHDAYRVDHRGRGSFDRVDAALARLKDAGLPVGVCVVVSRATVAWVDEIWNFMAERRLAFNIIPMMRSGAARGCYGELGLGPDEYADFFIPLYDRWFNADEDYVHCSDFVFKTRAIMAGRPADCIALEQCADTNISVDPVGDVYPCASVSGHADQRYGNVLEDDLETLMATEIALDHRRRHVDPQCRACKWQPVCHGGCPARAYKFFADHHARDYYCPSLYRIYEHIAARVSDKFREIDAGAAGQLRTH